MIRLAFCPFCGNMSRQTARIVYDFTDTAFEVANPRNEREVAYRGFGATCGTCGHLLVCVVGIDGIDPEDDPFQSAHLVWPKEELDWRVPETVAKCYAQALRSRENSPNGYSVLVRRSLEAVCDDFGIAKAPLAQRLSVLTDVTDLPPIFVEVARLLRQLGNRAAHDASSEIVKGEVHAIDDLFKALVEYVYVTPAKVAELKSLAPASEAADP